MTIYMYMPNINGNVTTQGYEKWIEIETFAFSVQRKLNTQPGQISNREASKPIVSEVALSKPLDSASSLLFSAATVGQAKSKVKIIFITGNVPVLQPFLEYEFSNVIVSSHAVSYQSRPDQLIESIHLNFDKVEMKVIPTDGNHRAESPIPASYDLNLATAA